jgi:hypothetical protein
MAPACAFRAPDDLGLRMTCSIVVSTMTELQKRWQMARQCERLRASAAGLDEQFGISWFREYCYWFPVASLHGQNRHRRVATR